MLPAGSSFFWLGSFSLHKAGHTFLLFTAQYRSKLALKMDFCLSSKNFDGFCPEVGYFCHAWVGDKFCTNWTLTDARLCLWLPAWDGWGGIPLYAVCFFCSKWLPPQGQLETKDSYNKMLVNLGVIADWYFQDLKVISIYWDQVWNPIHIFRI